MVRSYVRKVPAPTKYDPVKDPERARKLAYLGATLAEIAEQLGVSHATLWHWATNNPEFAQALMLGRDYADNRIIHTLYKRALGFEHVDESIIYDRQTGLPMLDDDGEPMVKVTKTYFPPDPSSLQFWLRNRQRDEWSDRKQLEIGAAGEFDKMTNEQLLAYINEDGDDNVIEGEVADDEAE